MSAHIYHAFVWRYGQAKAEEMYRKMVKGGEATNQQERLV